MDTIRIKIEGRENTSFFISLLEKFNFIKEVSVNNDKSLDYKRIEDAPVEWAKEIPSIDDFNGIWKDNSITINDIRTKGWKRN